MRHYLSILLRSLWRDRLYAALNVSGLALGLACCLLLGLFLRSELSYDRHNTLHSRIYRVANELTASGRSNRLALSANSLGPMLVQDYPQIQGYVRFLSNANNGSTVALHHGDDTYYWANSYFVDDNVFQVFTHRIIYGDPRTALKEQGSIAVSETFARKYFGDANPIGQLITTDVGIPQKITLVFADLPANSHLKYDILWTNHYAFLQDPEDATGRGRALWNLTCYTYLLVAPGFDPAGWPRISQEFYQRHMVPFGRVLDASWSSWLQPLARIHLYSDVEQDQPTDNPLYIYACAAVALFILIVACINYTNLATARASRSARAVGVRKILGAGRTSIALQFLGESVLFSLLSMLLAVALVEAVLGLSPLGAMMAEQVRLDLRAEPLLALWLLGFALLLGLLAGAYPAVYLSSWAPLTALTGRYSASRSSLRLREALVLIQLTISAAVIASTLLMEAQMRYIASKSLGFQKENRLVVTLRGANTIEAIPTLRAELSRDSHVLAVSEVATIMGGAMPTQGLQLEGQGPSDPLHPEIIHYMAIGPDFVPTMGLVMKQGRDFSHRLLTDVGTNFLVNEALVRKMGWKEPLGKRVSADGVNGRVIGVVGDFNFKSLRTLIEPLVLAPVNDDFSQQQAFRALFNRLLVVAISGEDVGGTVQHIEEVMRRVDPRHPFEFVFLDSYLDNLYRGEQTLTRLIGAFAAICILIACLGLFGLSAFTTEQRAHEIATRKVLGSTTWQIITLLSRRVLLLVVMGGCIASLIAYFAVDSWLTNFAYRAPINPLVFLISIVVAAAVTFGTVALQSYRAASANPSAALRHG